MLYIWLVILILLNILCLGLILFGLPGNWLIVMLTCLFAWWRAEEGVFSIYTLVVIAVLALLGELIEFFGGMGGAKRAGAGWRGSVGALLGAVTGGIIGTFLLAIPFLGTLIGTCAGAGIGACLLELSGGRKMKDSARSGLGAGLGEFLGLTAKIAIGLVIWHIVAVAAFWP